MPIPDYLAALQRDDAEDIGIRHGRERRWLERQPTLWGHAAPRLAWLQSQAYVATDEEIERHDAAVLAEIAADDAWVSEWRVGYRAQLAAKGTSA